MKSRSIKNIVFESPRTHDKRYIERCIQKRCKVYILEPFHAYHHQRAEVPFYPTPLPAYIDEFIKQKKVVLIKIDKLNIKEIYSKACDRAVDNINAVYPSYLIRCRDLVCLAQHLMQSEEAEQIFKKRLTYRLAEFYSVNMLLNNVSTFFDNQEIVFVPDTNVSDYLYVQKLLKEIQQKFFDHANIRFPKISKLQSKMEGLFEALQINVKIVGQVVLSGIGFVLEKFKKYSPEKKNYNFAMSVLNHRQLYNDERGPAFLIDNKKIKSDQVAYIPYHSLKKGELRKLKKLYKHIIMPTTPGKDYSNFKNWIQLLPKIFRADIINRRLDIKSFSVELFYYFSFLNLLKKVHFRHFITHCDFGLGYLGRVLAMRQAGVETWYYTDSINVGKSMQTTNSNILFRHPFWTYLCYDHLVTWSEYYADYFQNFPGGFKQTHIVGCLWSAHISSRLTGSSVQFFPREPSENRIFVGAFDTSYTCNSVTSYREGILFALHLRKLINQFDNIYLIFKEKKPRKTHWRFDAKLGMKLSRIYDAMERHPRIRFVSSENNSSDVMAAADVVISFPFTSTTFESLSANKKAFWHDPLNYYKETVFSKVYNLVTHGYKQLRFHMEAICSDQAEKVDKSRHQELYDPYCDGQAIDRFRDLLYNA